MFRKKNKEEAHSDATESLDDEMAASQLASEAPVTQVTQQKAVQPAAGQTSPPGAGQEQPFLLDQQEMISCFANFCRVTGTPEEVILDLGLNAQPMGAPSGNVKVSQRVIISYYTAKRILAALHMTVSRHEQAFGPIETDVRKRATPAGATS